MVPEIVFEIVELYRNEITPKEILKVLGVSSSTYHRWKKMGSTQKTLTDNEIAVINLCKETKLLYGYRKITALLRKTMDISHNTVQKIMQRHQLNCRVKVKKYRKLGEKALTCDNQLNRDFKAFRRYEKLVTDITYIPFGPRMLYLSSIMDCYNGEIISYTLSDRQDVSLVLNTLNQLPKLSESCILHSD